VPLAHLLQSAQGRHDDFEGWGTSSPAERAKKIVFDPPTFGLPGGT